MTKISLTDQNKPVALGVLFILTGALAISVQDVIFKIFSTNLPLWQIFALRAILTIPAFVLLARLQKLNHIFRKALGGWVLLRAFCLTMTFTGFYAVIPFLTLSTIGAANYIAPIFVALLSAAIIGESLKRTGWIGVIAGFAGVIVLLKPGTDAFSPWVIVPVIGALFYAFGHIITRTKCQGISTIVLALSVTMVMLAVSLATTVFLILWPADPLWQQAYPNLLGPWIPVGPKEWLVLTLLAALAVAIGMLLAAAYQVAPPPTVATFEYCYLVFVAIWDLTIFGAPPSLSVLAGMGLIVGAGILVLRQD